MQSDLASRAEILRLSRLGAGEAAWTAFRAGGWDSRPDADATLLRARLIKDEAARASGDERQRKLLESAGLYARAAKERRSTYALINAASLALLGGRPDAARARALEVLGQLGSGDHEPDLPYWLDATRAEALLVLGDLQAAAAALGQAVATRQGATEDVAITLRQFGLLLDHLGEDRSWLDACRPGPVLHYRGILALGHRHAATEAAIADEVAAIAPVAGIGALAAGADIIAAETLCAAGTELHVVLPCEPEVFRAKSVVAVDSAWGSRFDRLLEAAASLEVTANPNRLTVEAVAIADEFAAGDAIGRAAILETSAVGLRVGAEGEEAPPTPVERAWVAAGRQIRHLKVPRAFAVAPLPTGSERPQVLVSLAGAQTGSRAGGPGLDPDRVRSFRDLSAALHFARVECRLEGCGLDYRLGSVPLSIAELGTVTAAAEAAQAGEIIATQRAATSALLYIAGLRNDLVGEVLTPFGSETLWRMRPPKLG